MWRRKKLENAVRTALCTEHQHIWRFALALSRSRDLADDLVQATCVRALERANTVTHDTALRAWLLTICRSIWLNDLRAQAIRRTSQYDETVHVDTNEIFHDSETNIFVGEVFKAVLDLPESQREVVMLVYVLGYRYREASEILNVPMGTVMSRLSSARAKLAPLGAATGQVIALPRRQGKR